MTRIPLRNLSAGLAASAFVLGIGAAFGEEFNMGNRPWDFTAQNRAGIAALIEQKANGTLGGDGTGGGAGNSCGGNGGNSTAIGNYTCIILNDSEAAIEQWQKELGDQTANTQTATAGDDLSDVLLDLTN